MAKKINEPKLRALLEELAIVRGRLRTAEEKGDLVAIRKAGRRVRSIERQAKRAGAPGL